MKTFLSRLRNHNDTGTGEIVQVHILNGVIIHTIGFTLLVVAILLLVKPYIMHRLEHKNLEAQKQEALKTGSVTPQGLTLWEKRYRSLITALIGAFVGFLVGLTSVCSSKASIFTIALCARYWLLRYW